METIKGTHYAGSPLDKLRTTTAKGVPEWRTITLKHFACSITEKKKQKSWYPKRMGTETVSGRVRQRKYLSGASLNQNDIIFNGAELNPDWNT